MTRVDVWWRTPMSFDPACLVDLDDAELARYRSFRRPVDRHRFAIGASTVRRAVASRLGIGVTAVTIDRRCPTCSAPHGRPTLPGTGLHVSVTHAGAMVGVSLADVEVGLDVEPLPRSSLSELEDLVGSAWSSAEARPSDAVEFGRVWTRKEAVVKATGDGMTIGLRNVVVTGAADDPALLSYPGREIACALVDLAPMPGHVGALCVLRSGPVAVVDRSTPG